MVGRCADPLSKRRCSSHSERACGSNGGDHESCEGARQSADALIIFALTPAKAKTIVPRVPAHSSDLNGTIVINPTPLTHDPDYHSIARRMRLRSDSLRVHRRTGDDDSLPLPGLPAIQRGAFFLFRHRADGSFQGLARFTALPCLAQRDGGRDPAGLLCRLRLAARDQARRGPAICRDPVCEPG